MKICRICKEEKSLDCFHNNSKNLDGKDLRCKSCKKEMARKEYVGNYFKSYTRVKKSWCKSRNVPFDLTEDYLQSIWTGVCPIFNIEISFGGIEGVVGSHNSAHLDRIDSDKGYLIGNVAWISGRANRIKYDASIIELRQIADWMESVTTIPKGSTPEAFAGGSGEPLFEGDEIVCSVG